MEQRQTRQSNRRLLHLCLIGVTLTYATYVHADIAIDPGSLRKMIEHLRDFAESDCKNPIGRWMAKDIADRILSDRAKLPNSEQNSPELQKFDEALLTLNKGKDEYDKARYHIERDADRRCKELYSKGADQLEQLLKGSSPP